ncbi:hypothetical protein PAXRUDRAFT_619472 [Paxillus rubicundulus Ve08.2h10]|uniref:Unplaced genomic scaffold scaffold_54, whole genome shotgun sequence n=1 Tax=Paxillus rubicundulus Ve08.2h10 TaxID=930991 RepID=A0A0D0DKE0_9AGAM|nr:hypothetical protein PAXRUDRAFT_619472 [Paxillus rubicundulus Ve08.2h10]
MFCIAAACIALVLPPPSSSHAPPSNMRRYSAFSRVTLFDFLHGLPLIRGHRPLTLSGGILKIALTFPFRYGACYTASRSRSTITRRSPRVRPIS